MFRNRIVNSMKKKHSRNYRVTFILQVSSVESIIIQVIALWLSVNVI